MSKILVADDSPTIQKVIAITLADEPYELEQSHSAEDLQNKVKSNQYDLILLDFNLSDSITGLELAKSLRSSTPAPIMALVGTFDTINQTDMRNAGINDYIAKPFESDKFISKCRDLLKEETFDDETQEENDEDVTELQLDDMMTDDSDDIEEWKLNDSGYVKTETIVTDETSEESFDLEAEDSPAMSSNSLMKALEGWGMSVPEVIAKEPAPLPISKNKGESAEISLPSEDDLEYPNFELEEKVEPKSKLISLDELAPVDEEDDDDSTDPTYQMPSLEKSSAIELEREIEAEISPEEFWAVDDGGDSQQASGPEIHASIKIEENFKPPTESELVLETRKTSNRKDRQSDVGHLSTPAEIDYDLLIEKLKPYIDSKIQEYIAATINQVAWEVIPELSENIIRKEVTSIAEKVLNQNRQ